MSTPHAEPASTPSDIEALRRRLQEFVNRELLPLEGTYTSSEQVPAEVWAELQSKAKAAGFWNYSVPTELGGQGFNVLESCIVMEELNKTRVTPFRFNDLFGPSVGPILYSLNDEQKERYLYPVIRGEKRACFAQTEPGAGSDPSSMTTTAQLKNGEYVVNGVKRFIGSAHRADFAQLVCKTGVLDNGRAEISVLLVDMDTPGIRLVRQFDTMMGDRPWEIAFEDVRVPAANLVGAQGDGFRLAQRWLTRNRVTNHGGRCVGIAQRALEMAMRYADQRVTFGRRLSERQAIQFMIADSALDVRAARLMVYDAARLMDAGADARNESYMAKIFATEAAGRVVDRAMQIHGGIGLTTELPFEYWYRQLRSLRITEGVTEVLRWRLARNLMRELD